MFHWKLPRKADFIWKMPSEEGGCLKIIIFFNISSFLYNEYNTMSTIYIVSNASAELGKHLGYFENEILIVKPLVSLARHRQYEEQCIFVAFQSVVGFAVWGKYSSLLKSISSLCLQVPAHF